MDAFQVEVLRFHFVWSGSGIIFKRAGIGLLGSGSMLESDPPYIRVFQGLWQWIFFLGQRMPWVPHTWVSRKFWPRLQTPTFKSAPLFYLCDCEIWILATVVYVFIGIPADRSTCFSDAFGSNILIESAAMIKGPNWRTDGAEQPAWQA